MSLVDEASEAGSPAWWFRKLGRDLQDRRAGRLGSKVWKRTLEQPQRVPPGIDLLGDHLAGDPPLLGVADGWREGFREVARLGRLNVASLIVEAKANRMPLRDFRTAAADDELGDKKAREIMRANDLKVRSRQIHTDMLSLRIGYAMITPATKTGDIPSITSEDPRNCITVQDPLTGKVRVGLKMMRDEYDSADLAYLYIRRPDGHVWKYKAKKPGSTSLANNRFVLSKAWAWDGIPEQTVGDRMPIVPFLNRDGVGEYERHLDTLDRINDQILNKLIIAKIQAFRQRAVKGLPDTQKVLEGGKLIEKPIDYSNAFIAGPGELWKVPADVDFWESEAVDLNPIRMAIKDDIEHLAGVTSTPLHILSKDAASGSAEGASLMREEHVYAVEACRDAADRSWADVMATCFAFMGDTERANAIDIDAMWGPVERYSVVARSQAAQNAKGSLPNEIIRRDIWQYSPAEIQDMRQLDGRDLLTGLGDRDPFEGIDDAALAAATG